MAVTHQPIAEFTDDEFLGGRITLRQPVRGHRVGLDAALLQAALPENADGHVIDMGTGCGVVAFCAAARCAGITATGFDFDPEILELARSALALAGNGAISSRVRLVEMDAASNRNQRADAGLPDDCADWVLMNPPYDDAGTTRASPDPLRRRAHVGEGDGLDQWFRCASGLAKPGGRMAIVHRASRIGDIIAAASGRFGGFRILPFHPRPELAAKRVVVGMTQGSSAPPALLPGLVVHQPSDAYSEAIDDILAGKATLPLW